MASLIENSTSALNEVKESVTATVAASTETVKSDAAAATEKAVATKENLIETVTTQARDAVDNVLSRGIEEAKNFLHVVEEKKTEVSSKLVGAVTSVVGGASSSTVASRDLPVSTDNQPLLIGDRGTETTPWWKNCCGVLDLFQTSTTK